MYFSYQLNSEVRVNEDMDLGVLFDKKLSVDKQINIITSKAYSRLGKFRLQRSTDTYVVQCTLSFDKPSIMYTKTFIIEYKSTISAKFLLTFPES